MHKKNQILYTQIWLVFVYCIDKPKNPVSHNTEKDIKNICDSCNIFWIFEGICLENQIFFSKKVGAAQISGYCHKAIGYHRFY